MIMASTPHQFYLRQALNQASLGRGQCAPNPSVGAIAVQDSQIIAQAYHHGAGTAHAEQLILIQLMQQAEQKFDQVTLYVTLEPCNHWGRTPPCVEAIIQSGIKKVVFAFKDPNPLVANHHSMDVLKAHGVDVIHESVPEIDVFYQSYFYWTKHQRPWVTVKMAQSLDGKIAAADGKTTMLSNQQCMTFTHVNRQITDAILTTANTIIQDNPQLNARTKNGILPKVVVILDRHCRVNVNARIFQTAKHCYVLHDSKCTPQIALPHVTHQAIAVDDEGLDLNAVMDWMGKAGFHDVWVEAGATLFQQLHQLGLVQRTYLYITPHVLGAKALSAYSKDAPWPAMNLHWQVMDDNVVGCVDWHAHHERVD